MDILIKLLQFILSLSLLVIVHEFGHFLFAPDFQDAGRKVLPVLQPVVLAVQVPQGRDRVRHRLDSVRRIRQNIGHDRRIDGHRPDEAARTTLRVPGQAGLAAAADYGRRRRDEYRARPADIHRHELGVGQDLSRSTGTSSTATPTASWPSGSDCATATGSWT